MAISGKIFISYRRSDAEGYAGRIFDRLGSVFSRQQIFMDVDTIQPGENFVEAIENAVSSCDVLIALIGDEWLTITDENGDRRLDNPEDFVHVEITTALKRGIRVIPILLAGTSMPKAHQLPPDLKLLTKLNALEIRHGSFNADVEKMITAIETHFQPESQPLVSKMLKNRRILWGIAAIGLIAIFGVGYFLFSLRSNPSNDPDDEPIANLVDTITTIPTNTLIAPASKTPEPSSIILDDVVPTPLSITPTTSEISESATSTPSQTPTQPPTPTLDIPYGEVKLEPMDRTIEHILPDPGVRMNYASGIWQLDFIAKATFHNPYSNTIGPWDIGFMFRDMGKQDDTGLEQLRLVISSDGIWYLMDYIGNSLTDIDQGKVDNLDTSEGGKNHLILLADGEVGSFYLNGVKIADLDLSTRLISGGVAAAVSFLPGRNIEMGRTEIEGFTVWDINRSP